MKYFLFKTNLFLFLLLFTIVTFSCKNSDISPNGTSIEGTYKAVVNPLLCSMPTMSDLSIKSQGKTYDLTFKHSFTASKEVISNVKILKTDSTTILIRDGIELGKYMHMKYLDLSDGGAETVESMVLMLRFDSNNKHYEFMGRK